MSIFPTVLAVDLSEGDNKEISLVDRRFPLFPGISESRMTQEHGDIVSCRGRGLGEAAVLQQRPTRPLVVDPHVVIIRVPLFRAGIPASSSTAAVIPHRGDRLLVAAPCGVAEINGSGCLDYRAAGKPAR